MEKHKNISVGNDHTNVVYCQGCAIHYCTTVYCQGCAIHYCTTYLQMVQGLLADIAPCVLTQCTNQKTLDFLNNNIF